MGHQDIEEKAEKPRPSLPFGETDFDGAERFVRSLTDGELEEFRDRLPVVASPTTHPAHCYGLILLTVKIGEMTRARTHTQQLLRVQPWQADRLRAEAGASGAAVVDAAERIVRAEQETTVVENDLALVDKPLEKLRELRAIIAREPRCVLAIRSYQKTCEKSKALSEAEELLAVLRDRDEKPSGLYQGTAKVAFAAGKPERAVAITIEGVQRGIGVEQLEQTLRSKMRKMPDLRPMLQELLERARAAEPDAEGKLAAFVERVLVEAAPSRAITPAKANRDRSARTILEGVRDDPEESVRASLRELTLLRKKEGKLRRSVLFRYLCLYVRTGNLAAARDLERELQKDAPRDEYHQAAGLLLAKRDFAAALADPAFPDRAKLQSERAPAAAPAAKKKQAFAAPGREGPVSSLSTKKLKKLVGEVLVGQATARSVGAALSFEQEVAVAERLMAWAKEHAGRSEHLSRVVEQRIVAMARDNYFNRSWAARFSCLYLHLLAGQAQRFDDRAKDGVALELERAMRTAPGSYAESMWTRCFHEQYGRHEWDGLIEIGNLGYRLEEPAEQGGHQVTFRLVSAAPDPALPKRLAIVLVYGHELVAREKTRRDVQALAKESPSRPILVAVFEGKADYRLLDHQTVMSRYGAECVKLEGLTGEGLKAALREARDRLGSIPNPLQKFPKVGKDLTQDDLVPRLLVVPALEDALSSQYAPVVVYCMRKSGKTSTAKLLRLVTNERVVDLSQSLEGFDKDPYQLLKHLRNIEPLEAHRTGVLVLDEFDYFARQLKNQPEAVAMTYLNWLREAARHSRILCLGLDPFPFRTLYPASNPFQELTEFHLPYFSERECAILTQKMAGQLRLEDRLVEWLWKQSGGHPGVLRGLLEWYLEVRFGKNVQRIPTKDPLLLRDVPIERLEADFGNAERASILKTILDTMRSDTEGTLREAWKVMQQVIVHEPDGISRSALEKQLAVVDLWPAGHASEHPSIGLSLLFSWGLIRQSLDGSIHTTIPLLRRQLRSMQRLPNEG